MEPSAFESLLGRQGGVIARSQVLGLGGTDADLARLVRRRTWRRLHNGIYVAQPGEPSWEERAWGAVLALEPAALSGPSALVVHRVRVPNPASHGPIEVVVAETRRVRRSDGVVVHRLTAYDEVVLSHLSPPRVRLEHAVLTVASRQPSEDASVALLADVCQSGRTTAARLRDFLGFLPTLQHRALLLEVLDDVAVGAYSALERRYLTRVERAHGLPTGSRQVRVGDRGRTCYRDVEYGRLGHDARPALLTGYRSISSTWCVRCSDPPGNAD